MMLADYLRYRRGLTGTKIVCAEGDCGACTVLRAFPAGPSGNEYLPVNSCIMLVAQLDGSSLVTVDALAENGAMTPVQSAMMSCHGSQCGFCTPGFVMALTGLVEKRAGGKAATLTPADSKNALTGNLCRCTGYQQIIDAATAIPLKDCERLGPRFLGAKRAKELKAAIAKPLLMKHGDFLFFAPKTLKDAAAFLGRNKDARVLGAATDLGVFHNKGRARLSKVVSLHLVTELYETKREKNGRLRVGARVTLADLREELKARSPRLAAFLDIFASPQIKNVATLVGNVANASPIADTPPMLMVSDAIVHIVGPRGKRDVAFDEFYLGYRKTALKPGELIAAVSFAPPSKNEKFDVRKVSERKDLDISAVNAGFRLLRRADGTIEDVRIAFGGVGPTPLRLRRTEEVLRGEILDDGLREKAVMEMQKEISPIGDVRGSAAYRRVLAENLFREFLRDGEVP